ncbi:MULTISPECIES: hypothetical protein [Arthrobacter]|uniref:Thiosulfate dehydrogenase [quinone] large subunit n=2 Tax=Arthrobacter TaxID=1663 RepID=A0ABU9KLT8_9MICC|nr:hypothetical protein [Arthrobacter sp. YJM1]MDP5228208.1 hypothetical protein [Arthrobacter sp. YJM1]
MNAQLRGRTTPARLLPYLAVAARVALGVLWLGESRTKFAAGFGAADIGLVVQSTAGNSRVPGWYADLLAHTIGAAPALAGVAVPLTEGALGVLLVLGVLPRWVAAAATLVLASYWLSDQLIVQYPVMLALGAVVLLFPAAAARLSVVQLVPWLRTRRHPGVVHPRFTRP